MTRSEDAMQGEELRCRVADLKTAYYIKLGKGGRLAEPCFKESKLYIGFFSGPELVEEAARGPVDWDRKRQELKDKPGYDKTQKLTSAINAVRKVLEDDGRTMWFTMRAAHLYWTFIDASRGLEERAKHGAWRRVIGWNRCDLKGRPIALSRVSGRIASLQRYMGTICSPHDEDKAGFRAIEYLRNLVLGEEQPFVTKFKGARDKMLAEVERLIRMLLPSEFENFVDMIFVGDGWQRVTEVGGGLHDIDGEYVHATTGSQALVQVKSSTNIKQFRGNPLANPAAAPTSWLYWVYHSSRDDFETKASEGRVMRKGEDDSVWYESPEYPEHRLYLMDCRRLAELALRKGLIDWLTRKSG